MVAHEKIGSHIHGKIPSPNPDYPQEINNVEGKNKFGISSTFPITKNGLTFTKNSDGTITINGTATTTFTQTFNLVNEVLNGNYVIKHNLISGTVSENCYMTIQDSNNNNISDRVYGGTSFGSLTVTNTTIVTAGLYINSGTVFSNYTVGTMLQEGSVATPYVPYNSIEFKVENKNKLSINDIHNGSFTNINELQNETYTETSNTKYRTIRIDNLPAGTYTMTINWNKTARLLRYVKDNTLINIGSDNNTFTFTTTTSGLFGISFRNTESTNFDDSDYTIQIEEGSTATSYVEHAEQTSYFTFEEGQYLAEGGYLEDRGIYNNRNHVVLDGTTTGRKVNSVGLHSSSGLYYCQCNNVFTDGKTTSGANVENLLCTHFQANTTVATNHCYRTGNGSIFVFILQDQTITTAEQANAWLQEQYANGTPVTVEYELADPQPTPYTPTQQAQWNAIKAMKTYKNVSHISTEGGTLEPSNDVVYYKDLETLFNNMTA